MNYLNAFFITFGQYISELWWFLAIGFLISGIFYVFIPTASIEKYLGRKGPRAIFIASFVGMLLPVCCLGSLPIAVTLKRKGASLGATMAFLVATPATSVSALLVCWKLLGWTFTVFIFFSAMALGMIIGLMIEGFKITAPGRPEPEGSCCHSPPSNNETLSLADKTKTALQFAFVKLPKDIGFEILIGVSLASFLTVCEPLQAAIREYLTGALGYIFVLAFGLVTYVCSTASVPMADAFVQSGMSYGQVLCYLIVGPITSYGTILVIRKDFGRNVLILYLVNICVWSVIFGLIFDFVF